MAKAQTFTTETTATAKQGVLSKVGGFFAALGQGVVNARHISALQSLSDRQLADLGIKREDIARHVMGMKK